MQNVCEKFAKYDYFNEIKPFFIMVISVFIPNFNQIDYICWIGWNWQVSGKYIDDYGVVRIQILESKHWH